MNKDGINTVRVPVVRSLAGRDRGRYFVAVAQEGRFAFISDGKERKLSKPKRKNRVHISPVGETVETKGMTDKKLRKLLRRYENAPEEN